MTRRGFLKGLLALAALPTTVVERLLDPKPLKYPVREILVSVQPMTRPAPPGIFFFDWRPPRLSWFVQDILDHQDALFKSQGVTLRKR